MAVHNHGSEEGSGLSCREVLVNGEPKGECLRTGMADDLRTRIAAAAVGHADYVSGLTRYCTCGQWSGDSTGTRIDFSRHLADAVIRELGLRREGHPSETITNEQGATFYREGGHRYVTEWIADD